MLFDCFIFYNEIHLLDYRLNLLKDIVDCFVIVESKFTFTGKPKESFFDKNKFKNFNIKLITLNDIPYPNPTKEQIWKNEKYQRNCIQQGIDHLNDSGYHLNDSDYIIISDVDEIPDPETLLKIKNENIISFGQFEQDFYYYNLDSKMDHNWYFSKILKYSAYCLMGISCDDIRNTSADTIPRGGWHLSYFGDTNFISNKIQNFSHQEYNLPEFTDTDLIQSRIDKKIDLFGRNIKINPPNNLYLPPNYLKVYCFIHSCNLPETGTKMLSYLLAQIKHLPFEKIFINNIGIPINTILPDTILTNYSTDINLFEIPTINKMRQFAIENPNAKVLYLHTKGISNPSNCINDWIDMMLYFLLQESCIKSLNIYDTVGCNYQNDNINPAHYSGNFWWATSKYLSKLPVCGPNKFDAEFWLHINQPNYLSLHNSGLNHYYERYPRKNYDFISKITSAWTGHRDFAEWLVDYLKPKTIVELGVDYGFSSFVFAKRSFGTVYGIDLFTGDSHAGERDTYNTVKETINEWNLTNLKIIKGDFTEVSKTWDIPIDILHIDGYHTYDAVKNDFTNWSKFVNNDGIILFHDTAIEYFGIKDFFKELPGYKLEFKHSAGLGIYTKNKELYQTILSNFDNVYGTEVIGFHACGHLCERGTDVAMFDYAYFNQKINHNKSIIFYENGNELVIEKFKKEFEIIKYNSFEEINNYQLDYFYNIKPTNESFLTKFKNLTHVVFEINENNLNNLNEIVAVISDSVKNFKQSIPVIPHMINLPEIQENLRNQLGILPDSIVFGRYGGYDDFDILYTQNTIKEILSEKDNIYFLFMNTFPFYIHPRIIYLPLTVNLNYKVKFINTCDAMIHARVDGESFGLSIGEFSSKNKPIITSRGNYNTHLDILGNLAIIYDSQESLLSIFKNFKPGGDWNAYQHYTPEKVMKRFNEIFLNPEVKPIGIFPKQNLNFDKITIVTAFYDIGRDNWNNYNRSVDYYFESFYNYFKLDYQMVIFIDERYMKNFIIKNKNKIFIPINQAFLENNIHAWKNLNKDHLIINSDEYKKLINHRNSPETIYSEYNCINHAKIDFLNFALPFIKTDFICWSDFGYHSSILQNDLKNFPTDILDISKFNIQKINMFVCKEIPNYYDPVDTLVNAPDIFTGSFYGLPVSLLSEFQKLYHESVDELYSLGISDDDQHILLRCFYKKPELFEIYLSKDKWPEALVYFQKNENICINVPTNAAGLGNTLKSFISWLSIDSNTKIQNNLEWIAGNYSEILDNKHIYKSGNVKMYSHWRFIILKNEEDFQQNINELDFLDWSDYSPFISNKVFIDLCYDRSLICDKVFNRIMKGISLIKWNNVILLEVDRFLKLMKGNVLLGVSIRTWKSSHEYNVDRKYNKEDYINAIKSFQEKCKICIPFISFDNLDEEKEYTQFNYITYKKPEHITFLQYSCIKMLILSKFNNFICNRISTFSEMVFWLSGCKQNVIALF
jgi:beta-1,4-mannosyl-glycoprotein beta-1,4-N-acetylglucosaminyltransferase